MEEYHSKRNICRFKLLQNQLKSGLSLNLKLKNPPNILEKERENTKWNKNTLIDYLNGGSDKTERKKLLSSLLESNSSFSKESNLSEENRFKNEVNNYIEFQKKFNKLNPNLEDECYINEIGTYNETFNNAYNSFIRVLKYKGSKDQQNFWIPKAKNFEIIGSYVVNELAYDKFNLTNLQTKAIYDKKSKSFTLNTEDLESIKWWSCWLSKVSTHVVIHANLMIENTNYGIITLIVQIRDENHNVLPGIKLGDVGKKIGKESQDIGFIVFENLVISRDCLLSKHQQITDEGIVTQVPIDMNEVFNDEIELATLMVHSVAGKLCRAATIAIRYSCVKKRGFVECKGLYREEQKIIDYRIQRRTLMKQLSHAFALKFLGNWMLEQIDLVKNAILNGANKFLLEDLWYTFNVMKGMAANMTSISIEELRKCCGVNGYLLNSGIAKLSTDSMGWPENEYNVLGSEGVQFGAYSLKAIKSLLNNGPKLLGHINVLLIWTI